MRRLAETAVFCSVAPCWTATAQAHRGNDASKLDQEAVAGYSLSGRVLFGLRVDHFAEEAWRRSRRHRPRSLGCAIACAQIWPNNSSRLSRIDWLWSAKRASVGSLWSAIELLPGSIAAIKTIRFSSQQRPFQGPT